MHATFIVIILELIELFLQIAIIEKYGMIQVLSSGGSNHALNKRMRSRRARYRFQFLNVKDPQVALPSMKREHGGWDAGT
jgi:hypothetical protein